MNTAVYVSPETGQELLRAATRERLDSFTRRAFATVDPGAVYQHNWHIDAITKHLEACTAGEIRRLIINIPPRYMKSICVSVAWPAWLLGRDPTNKIIVGSYSQDLSLKHSVDTRLVVESPWYKEAFPHTAISRDQNEKRKFQTTERGHRISCSVGSAITGEGGDFLIVDDPHSPLEASSDVQRLAAINWFEQTFLSRQNNKEKACVVVIMQRLHEQDLTGHLLAKGGWEHLNLPVIAPKSYTISIGEFTKHVEEGELLHEERDDIHVITRLRDEMGPYAFAGQYMQTPAPIGGGEFKETWLRYYDRPFSQADRNHFFSGMNIYILVDPAHEKKKTSDYSAFIVIGANYDNCFYLLDIVRDKLNPTERVDKVFELHRKYNALGGRPPRVAYEINGHRSDAHYIMRKSREERYYINMVEVDHRTNKLDRIRGLIPLFQRGQILFPAGGIMQGAENLIETLVEKEMLLFPNGIHPDMLDAMAQLLDEEVGVHFPASPHMGRAIVNSEYEAFRPVFDQPQKESWLSL